MNIHIEKGGYDSMTQNQIAWLNYLENVRSHRAQEGETYRSNLVHENQANIGLAQDLRRTLSQERVSLLGIEESRRHNRAQEGIGYSEVRERSRSNRAREQLERDRRNADIWMAKVQSADRAAERRQRDLQHVENLRMQEIESRRKRDADNISAVNKGASTTFGILSNLIHVAKLI